MQITRLHLSGLLAAAMLAAGTAEAEIELRVGAWPAGNPIDVFAWVSPDGDPVADLTADDFAVTLDGQALDAFALAPPPVQEPTQRMSLVLVVTEPNGANALIGRMAVGDYVSIVTFREDRLARYAPIDVQPFTRIDGSTGNEILHSFLTGVYQRDPEDFRPEIIDLASALRRAFEQFESPSVALPDGPKAIILAKPGYVFSEFRQQSDIVAAANALGLPIFTIYSGAISPIEPLRYGSVAAATGGTGFSVAQLPEAWQAVPAAASILNEAYRIRLPADAVADCGAHTFAISARGETESIAFTRCDTTPEDMSFEDKVGVAPGTPVVSDPVTVTGIDSAVPVEVFDGEVSIGCNASFTSEPTIVRPYESLCVRHVSGQFHDDPVYTTLVIGGVPSSFSSITESLPPPPADDGNDGHGGTGGTGGGGSSGAAELLLLLGLLIAQAGKDIKSASCRPRRQPVSGGRTCTYSGRIP